MSMNEAVALIRRVNVLIDVDKQLSHVTQTFKEQSDKPRRVCHTARVLRRDVEVHSCVTRHHV